MPTAAPQPTLDERLASVPALSQESQADARVKGPRTVLLTTAVVGAVTAGTLYGLASHQHRQFEDATDISDLHRHQTATNGLMVGSMSAGTLAVASTVAFFVVR